MGLYQKKKYFNELKEISTQSSILNNIRLIYKNNRLIMFKEEFYSVLRR